MFYYRTCALFSILNFQRKTKKTRKISVKETWNSKTLVNGNLLIKLNFLLNICCVNSRLAHPKIVRACGLALRDFQTNSINTNNCIIKLLHRIAFDCKNYVMVFQVSIFRTFQKIYANKDFPQYRVGIEIRILNAY